MPNLGKQDTNLTFKSKSTLKEGDSLKVKLTSENGTALANQTIRISITDKNKASSHHSVVTDEKGVGTLKLDKDAGKYKVKCVFKGKGNYNACNASKKITVEEKVAEAQTTSSSSSSSSLPYSLNNLPPSNDPNPETRRYQVDEYTVAQEYSDNYRSYVDLRTGERYGGFF